MDPKLLEMLVCPVTKGPLIHDRERSELVSRGAQTTVRADAFCHSMVRALMGALVAVGEGRHEPAWAADVLTTRARDPRVKVMPPQGLVLEAVAYPDDEHLAARAFESRRMRGA